MLAYRSEYQVERSLGRLKGRPLSLRPMYVQRDDHATGLIRLLSIALRVLTLLEFVVRRRLTAEGTKLHGLYAGNAQRETARPTAERLLEAFDQAKKRRELQEQLVLVGRKGWLSESLEKRIRDMADAVVLAGYIPENDLPLLYAGATVFVLPSLFEGFGLPLLEAMACGTPVIAANTSSLPEVVGDAGLLFDPLRTEELAEALARLCEHRELREQLRARGLARAKQFTWEEAARKTLEVLKKVGES